MNIIEMIGNPLMQRSNASKLEGSFLRLVLAEALNYGMPPQVVATLDDVAAMLGCYMPLTVGQAAHLAGPLVTWRTHRFQPDYQEVVDIQMLAYKQRALIAFGAAPPGHMVGTAEIVHAMLNVHQSMLEKKAGVIGDYREVFYWASVDALAILSGEPKTAVWKEKGWKPVDDDEVLKPTGRLHAAYTEIATNIRRTTISSVEADPDHPRRLLLPIAKLFLDHHEEFRLECEKNNLPEAAKRVADAMQTIRDMFPELAIRTAAEPPG